MDCCECCYDNAERLVSFFAEMNTADEALATIMDKINGLYSAESINAATAASIPPRLVCSFC
jgi:hypothetical protein